MKNLLNQALKKKHETLNFQTHSQLSNVSDSIIKLGALISLQSKNPHKTSIQKTVPLKRLIS